MNSLPLKEYWEDLNVACKYSKQSYTYPKNPPFDPSERFPEYVGPITGESNECYRAVREAFFLLGLDRNNYGMQCWNPLGDIVEPGMKVVIKPNWVCDSLPNKENILGLFTNTCIIRTVLDYVQIALGGKGHIIIGDAPIQRTDWDNLQKISGMNRMLDILKRRGGLIPEVIDFRYEITKRDRFGVAVRREVRKNIESIEVDLERGSTLMPVIDDFKKFRVTRYDPKALAKNHNPNRNSYLVHKKILEADVVINLPKMKTHQKAGITCALKNLVGINCGKDWLPHHRVGDMETSAGDQYFYKNRFREIHSVLLDKIETGNLGKRKLAAMCARGIRGLLKFSKEGSSVEGNWYGNDTVWRMVHDLNLIICYANKNGQICESPQRKAFHIVDGIIAGEGNGPLQPTAKFAGTVLVGRNPVAVDLVAATIMGFNIKKVPLLKDAWKIDTPLKIPPIKGEIDKVKVALSIDTSCYQSIEKLKNILNLKFAAPPGWKNHVERINQ